MIRRNHFLFLLSKNKYITLDLDHIVKRNSGFIHQNDHAFIFIYFPDDSIDGSIVTALSFLSSGTKTGNRYGGVFP